MSLASELRDLYTPEQPTAEQAEIIGHAAVTVALRFLEGQLDMHPEAAGQFPLLVRTSDLLEPYAGTDAAEQYGYQRVGETDAIPDEPSDKTEEDTLAETEAQWFEAGFKMATSRFAAVLAEIALMPGKEKLKTAIQSSYDEDKLRRAVESVAAVQYAPVLGGDLTREWSDSFPGLAVVAVQLNETRPAYIEGQSFDQGFYEGVHYYPSVLGRYALVGEMPEI